MDTRCANCGEPARFRIEITRLAPGQIGGVEYGHVHGWLWRQVDQRRVRYACDACLKPYTHQLRERGFATGDPQPIRSM